VQLADVAEVMAGALCDVLALAGSGVPTPDAPAAVAEATWTAGLNVSVIADTVSTITIWLRRDFISNPSFPLAYKTNCQLTPTIQRQARTCYRIRT
jgi:hypothetical protein